MTQLRPARCGLLVLLLILFLAGCHRQPVRHLSSDACLLLPGNTTKQEVLSYLGTPDQRRMDPQQGEMWVYYEANKSFLRKTPLLGDNLGDEQYDVVVVTFQNDQVRTCVYRSFTEEQFKQADLIERESSDS